MTKFVITYFSYYKHNSRLLARAKLMAGSVGIFGLVKDSTELLALSVQLIPIILTWYRVYCAWVGQFFIAPLGI